MKRVSCNISILISVTLFFNLIGFSIPTSAAPENPPAYLTSATYFSDEWPINFWSSESRFLEEELKQIAEDGFNSIILVIPWREFQPNIYRPQQFNQYPMEKLDRIMTAANHQGLWVSVRLGYTWDYYEALSPLYRYEDLLSDPATKKAWLVYSQSLYKKLSSYPNFYGGFITWEDFWNFTENSLSTEINAARRKADSCGYTDYLEQHYTLEEISAVYDTEFTQFSEIYLPRKNHPSAKLFYEFYDEFLNALLLDTQAVFPELSMEVRLDQEPLYDADGNLYYYSHEATYPCQNSPYVSAMTSVAMGQRNNGEQIDASQGIATLTGYLHEVTSKMDGKKLYIEQFLYMDTTPEFSHNAQIKTEQVPAYIIGMAPALKQYSMGYGLWVYRNYADNQLYNPQFALNLNGWSADKGIHVETYDGSPAAKMNTGLTLRQSFRGQMRSREHVLTYVKFRAAADTPCTLTVNMGTSKKTIVIQGHQTYELNLGEVSSGSISFTAGGSLYLDDVNVYTTIQDARLYDKNGSPLDCLGAIQELNTALK